MSFRKFWYEGLRSGDYDQAQSYLRTPEGFCCLGVGCDVAVKNGLLSGEWLDGDLHLEEAYKFANYDKGAQDILQTRLSLHVRHLFELTEKQHNLLVALNDSGDVTFEQIADLLEHYPVAFASYAVEHGEKKEDVVADCDLYEVVAKWAHGVLGVEEAAHEDSVV